ncbi:hypothetical protein N748_08265 [Legionella pneumophila str. 121004]|nr:hypothetical protein N748_08265 [Legionella pneumophila str. 121004]ERH44048.1 hypothetical protein N750_10375 [Legionella pneumophila str. Leg01/53]ERH46676.1 hypothetical protein N751_00185 [Legionella pneumophila str. Leg01/11]
MHAEEKISVNTSVLEKMCDMTTQNENSVRKVQLIKPTKYSPSFFWPVP